MRSATVWPVVGQHAGQEHVVHEPHRLAAEPAQQRDHLRTRPLAGILSIISSGGAISSCACACAISLAAASLAGSVILATPVRSMTAR